MAATEMTSSEVHNATSRGSMGTGAVEGAPEEQHSGFMRSYFEKRGIAPRDVPMVCTGFAQSL